MSIRLGSGCIFALASLAFLPAHADQPISKAKPQDSGPQFNFVLGGAVEFGGDKIATVAFDDGSTQNIRAGQGLSGFAGGSFRPSPLSPWSVRATAGYKYNTTKASNASIGFGRVPLELIGSYHFNNGARVGTGLVYHTAIKLDGDGFFDNVKFRDTAGFKLETGWKWVVVSYSNLRYRASNVSGSANASNFGLTFLWEFGGK